MARAATSDELIKFRSKGQISKTHLAIYPAPTVYTARVNQTFTTTDKITRVTYDGGSGTLANVLPGMMMLVGSSAGASDVGIVRLRSIPTATQLNFGATSELAWQDDLYLTIIDDFYLWPRPATVSSATTYIDSHIGYTSQLLNREPVPVMGPIAAVLKLDGGSAALTMDWSGSYCPGSSVSGYATAASGPAAVTITNGTTNVPTVTFTQAGWYRIGVTLTGANAETMSGYRWVYVWDDNNLPSEVEITDNPHSDADQGGCSFGIRMTSGAGLASVRDHALAVLFAEDWYGSSAASIGPLAGYENVIAIGWIAGETIQWNPRRGGVTFQVRGPAYWLQQLDAQPWTLTDKHTGNPSNWTQIHDLTIDDALWYLAHWRTSITSVVDLILPGSTTLAQTLSASPGSVWEQLQAIAAKAGARPLCDRYGRIFIQFDPQLMALADRDDIPVVMDVGKTDWREQIELEHQTLPVTSLLELSADIWSGTAASKVWSRAPGNQGRTHGKGETVDGYVVASQAAANALAGMLLAKKNNPWPVVPISLAQNNRLLDICPQQYATVSIAAGDTVRGITWSTVRMIPKYVEYVIEKGRILAEIEGEVESSAPAGVTYIPPVPPVPNIPTVPTVPDVPPPDWPGPGDLFPPYIPPIPPQLDCKNDPDAAYNGPYQLILNYTNLGDGNSLSGAAYYPCGVRINTATFKTIIKVYGHLEAYINGEWQPARGDIGILVTGFGPTGGDLITAVIDAFYPDDYSPLVATFEPAAGTSVSGFKIALSGEGYTSGDTFATGLINVTVDGYHPYDNRLSGLTPGDLYSVEATGGPYHKYAGTYDSYRIKIRDNSQSGSDQGFTDIGGDDLETGYYEAPVPVAPAETNGIQEITHHIGSGGHYARAFFINSTGHLDMITIASGGFGNHSGSISYKVCLAGYGASMRWNITRVTLENICAA